MKSACLLLFCPILSNGGFSRDFFIKDSIVEGTWTNCAGVELRAERAMNKVRARIRAGGK